ncbi:MAG TPA: RHS repeat-associated core domain-containing protein [Segetibacter sp.]
MFCSSYCFNEKLQHTSDNINIDYYSPEVVTANDYYPFGMVMPGRKFNIGGAYRYGFNGKENDNEIKGEGNPQDYGLRTYDPRIGKFLIVDPLTMDFPWNSTYAFAENDEIRNVDLDGAEKHPYKDLPQWAQNTIQVIEGTREGLATSSRFSTY